MPLDFTNIIKGRVTESLLMALFERGGYRVTRLGVEELIAEVKHLDLSQYQTLHLPLEIRFLPDLLIVDIDMTKAFLVEAKFRRKFDDLTCQSLHSQLSNQHGYWPQSHAVIMIAEPFMVDASFHQDFIRVVSPDLIPTLIDQNKSPSERWEHLHHLQRVFKKFNAEDRIIDVQKSADRLTQVLRDLRNL